MKFIEASIPGVYIIQQDLSKDERGSFVKTYRKSLFEEVGLESSFTENYYTKSHEDVIRGMHFQVPPFDHSKLVTVMMGTIIDVLLDLRVGSPTYSKAFSVELSRENRKSIYIPKGIAHGFGVLSDMALAYYMVTSEYSPEHDKGVHYDSFDFDWPITKPIVSTRDRGFPGLAEFESPFRGGS